ncbi:hypothetical protein JVT61DRAFT_9285 [Boletus reticuloceps]|uniref:Uncharacterized protein n=1 Tax=Boletus reticuloceps TaxID=495285 RepID=A0A8I2YGM1_9AGAM|nr:hypothetical protein JVT61DRAFT_9285 [Boletus reticuloceps]
MPFPSLSQQPCSNAPFSLSQSSPRCSHHPLPALISQIGPAHLASSVYDSDSTFSPDNSIIAGLLRKFRAEGFSGELGWVRGGFQAVWREARDLATTEPPSPEEEDPDAAFLSGTLRTTHLPKAAFSFSSTTVAPPPHLGPVPSSIPLLNTPAPSASRAANPFFDTIRQNVELSHGITERIPLRLPRRVRRRIPDLPSRWLQDIARRSALVRSRHPGLDGLESGSESSDDPHTSDPDENDPNVEEGAEALAMQFYRIELAEQRRLRSIMEHHTRESSAFLVSAKPRRLLGKDGGGVTVRTGAKSVPGTPHTAVFPFSITAGVEKGTKNRYTHIWPFEHARVRLHDNRHLGSHLGRRDKGKASERGRSTRDRSRGKARERQEQDKHPRSRSSPASGKGRNLEATEVVSGSLRHSFTGTDVRLAHPTLAPGPSIPRVKIEYDTTEQDSRMSGPSTPATALPLPTPPFYTPMETLPASTPMSLRPPRMLSPSSPGERLGATQIALPTSPLSYLGPIPLLPLRLPNRSGGFLSSIGEQSRTSESLSSSATPFGDFINRVGTDGEVASDTGTIRDPRREPSPVDDYVNASYVQPLCTRKRYIATQGPLPSTYVDFWTLVWEQNVHVIVMLTREVENAMIKCGSYWTDTEYGPLRLELLSTSPPMSPSANPTTMDISTHGFFAIREPQGKTSEVSRAQPTLITRTFLLSHSSFSGVPPRRITHLQYLDWSDMNVPDDPRGVLDLVKKVEQAVAESTPGPSPCGSLSPGSRSGSLSGSQTPDVGSDLNGHEASLLSPTSAGVVPWGGRGRRGSEWRHPQLDLKSGIASFALGKAPVLLHCSAGVGRTGGFIAVDAMLDGIRRELRQNREERRLKKASRVNVVVSLEGSTGMNDVEANEEFAVNRTETGIATSESCGMEDESERMDVDGPTTGNAETTQGPLQMIKTVPIPVTAGDRMKGRRRHNHSKDPSGEKQCSSSELLVVHVPCAGTNDAQDDTNGAGIDLHDAKEADWQSSTREWAEKVSDQTCAHTQGGSLPPPHLLPPPSGERSPGSTSNSSGPSALNSADDSMGGSASADASGSAKSGVGNRVERKSDTGSASGSGNASGNWRPPPSLLSKPGSGSISLSTSGSGTGTGSRFGSSLLRARLRDSSVTSISAKSTDSLLPPKSSAPLDRPSSALHSSPSTNMEIDCPPRSVSVPLQLTYSSAVSLQRGIHSRHDKPILVLPSVARFLSPILPQGMAQRNISFGSDEAEAPTSRPNSGPDSSELTTLPQGFESGESPGAEGRGKNNQGVSDDSDEIVIPSKSETNLWLNTELSSLKVPAILHSGGAARNPPLPFIQIQGEGAVPLATRIPDGSALEQFPTASGVLGSSEQDQHAADHPVIDYKLPRELHSDLSPPPISSFTEPICAVIQDMREQRMSLCQSLRQYVFVHAAIIEGALRIVDEERELWGYSGTSDDASSAEGEPRAIIREDGRWPWDSEAEAWASRADVVAMMPKPEHGSILQRTRSLHTMTQPSNAWGLKGNNKCSLSLGPTSSSSSVSSPSKGKRAPSPTELLREDKTGALTLNKRPSIHRKRTSEEGDRFSFESSRSSPAAGETEGGSRDAPVGVNGARFALGRLAVPEKDLI